MKRPACVLLGGLALLAIARAPGDEPPRPELPDTEKAATRPLPPGEAAARFRAPEGFRVRTFASEPDLRNPVAMAWDPRGRLWVAENVTYSDITQKFDLRLRDRLLIFEDADGDRRPERRTIFTDDVQRLASVEIGLGGVWLLCPPRLLFVPDRNRDDRPDGPAEVVLDGFQVATENYHTFANGLRWGPDGWLYGRCGASSPGLVGVPGTPEAARVPIRGGLWRYHPARRRFEVLCHGTTNPWGHDWNALGEPFFINTTNGHLWHAIPGAHFARPHTIEPNPRVYEPIDQHADHVHWDNSKDKEVKYPYVPGDEDDRRGGGHAHSGVSIYLADQWPESYRGKLLTLNFHGRRVNVERLERSGSGYVGRHEPDVLFAADPWFRGIELAYGPDGAVFVLDWSDTGECHEHDGVHRNSGRIFKITYGDAPPTPTRDLTRLDDGQLLALHAHPNEWYARQARRVLVERAAGGAPIDELSTSLRRHFDHDADVPLKLRMLATLHAIGATDPAYLRTLLQHEHESVRAWAVRLLTDDLPIDTVLSQRVGPEGEFPADLEADLVALARTEPSGLVRLALASTLQRLPVDRRLPLAKALAARAEDANDHNLPCLIWTALIPVAEADPNGLVPLAAETRLPDVLRWTARRLAEDIEAYPAPLNALLALAADRPEAFQASLIAGMTEALNGWRKAPAPQAWDALQAKLATTSDPTLRDRLRDLNVLFGDGRALDEVRRLALDEHAPLDSRKAALRTLIEGRPDDLRAVCERLIRVRFLNSVAVRGLALFDDPEAGRAIAASYRTFHPSERPLAIAALASRPASARVLLDQIAAGKIPRNDLTAFHARQIRSLGDPNLERRLAEAWGELRDTPADRREQVARLKNQLGTAALAVADPRRGRLTFERLCASCHTLHGRGGDAGPDLTGANRDNLDYLLENLVDPSASVSADFKMSVVAMQDGRVLNGLIRAQNDRTLTLRTQNETLALDRAEIDEVRPSPLSLMPEGQLDPLSPDEVRDLIAYLVHPAQVPPPEGTSTERPEP